METGSLSSSPNGERLPKAREVRPEVVVLIGLQGAGKSTFRGQRFAETHQIVSKDLIRNNRRPERRQKHLITAALASGFSVVVDNTNPSVEERASIIATARTASAHVIGYFFESPLPECAARNQLRPERTRVPDVGLFAAAKRLVRPSHTEGFDELWIVRTLPDLCFDIRPYEDTHEPG
jgi:predicted kinase